MAGEYLENCQLSRIFEFKDRELEREFKFFE